MPVPLIPLIAAGAGFVFLSRRGAPRRTAAPDPTPAEPHRPPTVADLVEDPADPAKLLTELPKEETALEKEEPILDIVSVGLGLLSPLGGLGAHIAAEASAAEYEDVFDPTHEDSHPTTEALAPVLGVAAEIAAILILGPAGALVAPVAGYLLIPLFAVLDTVEDWIRAPDRAKATADNRPEVERLISAGSYAAAWDLAHRVWNEHNVALMHRAYYGPETAPAEVPMRDGTLYPVRGLLDAAYEKSLDEGDRWADAIGALAPWVREGALRRTVVDARVRAMLASRLADNLDYDILPSDTNERDMRRTEVQLAGLRPDADAYEYAASGARRPDGLGAWLATQEAHARKFAPPSVFATPSTYEYWRRTGIELYSLRRRRIIDDGALATARVALALGRYPDPANMISTDYWITLNKDCDPTPLIVEAFKAVGYDPPPDGTVYDVRFANARDWFVERISTGADMALAQQGVIERLGGRDWLPYEGDARAATRDALLRANQTLGRPPVEPDAVTLDASAATFATYLGRAGGNYTAARDLFVVDLVRWGGWANASAASASDRYANGRPHPDLDAIRDALLFANQRLSRATVYPTAATIASWGDVYKNYLERSSGNYQAARDAFVVDLVRWGGWKNV